MSTLDETHDPAQRSWVASANAPGTDFPLQNLPFGVFSEHEREDWRIGVAIGDAVLDVRAALAAGALSEPPHAGRAALGDDTLNAWMAAGPEAWSALRLALSRALREGSAARDALQQALLPQGALRMRVPARVGDYTDFYTSVHHATSVGRLFRPDHPLLPNYKHVPIGYHGRASSIRVSGVPFRRPCGQLPPAAEAGQPGFGPCKRLDYELELGAWIGPGNAPGEPIAIDQSERHVLGLCLLNDWSARDMQAWEYQPLGPFLSKNFATTVSPWVVTLEALAPFRCAWERPADDPAPLPYLDDATMRREGAFDIRLAVDLRTRRMREAGQAAHRLSSSSFRHAYWTLAQMVAHHTVNGCDLQPGDLLGSGTQSGPTADEAGSLLELTQGGRRAIELPGGEQRRFLEDGDEVTLAAWCERPGAVRIGFGECRAEVLPA